jgi:hypothetical protein
MCYQQTCTSMVKHIEVMSRLTPVVLNHWHEEKICVCVSAQYMYKNYDKMHISTILDVR